MAIQYFTTLVLLIFYFSSVNVVNGLPYNLTEDAHDVYQCPDPTSVADFPLCQELVEESGKLFQVITKTIKCPAAGVNKVKIACIMVTNLEENDQGGYSSIQSGGLDQYYVDIYLKSQRSKGLKFQVEVFTFSPTTTTTTTTTTPPP